MSLSSAIYSGLCASFASTFGKLSGSEFIFLDEKLRFVVKIICFCAMLILNSMVWTFFVKSLQKSRTAVEATAVSTASNYIFSGILGYLVFQEVTGLFWWFGISLVIMGILIVNSSNSRLEQEKSKT